MLDIFGFELFVGDTVAFISYGEIITGMINNINHTQLVIKYPGGYTNKFPKEIVKRVLDPADLKLLKFTIGSNQ